MKTKIVINIKNLINAKLHKNSEYTKISEEIRSESTEHGFQLINSDNGVYSNNRFSKEQSKAFINNINSYGYLDCETGNALKEMIDDPNYITYTKSINSYDVDSIFEEGVRCLGNTTSGCGTSPNSIDSIELGNTVSIQTDLPFLINDIKNHYGISQGGNPIDGTIIINVPRDISKEEIFYYNNESSTYNIKPEYITGFLPVDKNSVVGEFQFRKSNIKNK